MAILKAFGFFIVFMVMLTWTHLKCVKNIKRIKCAIYTDLGHHPEKYNSEHHDPKC